MLIKRTQITRIINSILESGDDNDQIMKVMNLMIQHQSLGQVQLISSETMVISKYSTEKTPRCKPYYVVLYRHKAYHEEILYHSRTNLRGRMW